MKNCTEKASKKPMLTFRTVDKKRVEDDTTMQAKHQGIPESRLRTF
jgi:hypothetical protein